MKKREKERLRNEKLKIMKEIINLINFIRMILNLFLDFSKF